MSTISLFLTGGTGYIGGAILKELVQNHSDRFSVTALVRTAAAAEKMKALGVTPLIGGYDNMELLVKAANDFDVIVHTGDSADNLPVAQAFMRGLAGRKDGQRVGVYLHTSGTGVLSDESHGAYASDKIYSDLRQAEIDELPDSQPHRKIDVFVREEAKNLSNKATSAIILPPNIYGVGTGPVNTISLQTPFLIRFALEHKFVPIVGEGKNWWNDVHVKDLARGYILLVDYLLKSHGSPWLGYWFAETGEHEWMGIYAEVARIMYEKKLVDSPTPQSPARILGGESDWEAMTSVGGKDAYDAWGSNSRATADRLRGLGWTKKEPGDAVGAIKEEVEAIVSMG